MTNEKIIYRGDEYEFTDEGLITVYRRKRQSKRKTETIDGPPNEKEVKLCMSWLEKFAKPASMRFRRMGSYGLKHVVERWSGIYVSNGAFILAAHHLGYRISPDDPQSPNAMFYMRVSEKDLNPPKAKPTEYIGTATFREDLIASGARPANYEE